MLRVKQRWLRVPTLILVGGVILVAFGVLATAYAIWSSREVTLRQWQTRLTAATHILNAHAVQTLDAADMMLRAAHDNLQSAQFIYEPDFRATTPMYRIHEMLRDTAHGLPQVNGIGILGNDGTVLNLSRQYPAPPINLADQDYFRAFEENPSLELFISQVNINRLSQEPFFYMARPIKSPSGERLGLLVAGLPSSFFSSFYHSAVLGDLHISLMRRDGKILARNFDARSPPNTESQPPSELLRRVESADKGILFMGGEGTRLSFDQMVAFDRSAILPISMSVSISQAQIFQEWEKQTINLTLIGVIMSILVLILTQLFARLVSQLEEARNAALSAADSKTRFIANVSHELRTPMNAIITGAHQLRHAELQPDARQTLQIISSSAQQLTVLINDILDFSYFDAREFRVEVAPFDPHMLAQNAMDMARTLAPDTKLELITKVDARVPALIMGDANRIKQIILNLLNNAIKYTERGKVELRVSYIRGDQNLLILQVIDTGPGISEKDRSRIFHPFERTEWAKQKPGTGLGLAICKKLAEAMSGSIILQSKNGPGTHFTVEIPAPIAQANQVIASKLDRQTPGFAPSLRILVAEDVAPSRMLLTLMLENMGHQVTAVENGLEAVYAASQSSFDLILMDLQMPEMDGIMATRRIRTPGGLNQSTRIIAVSANADLDGPQGLIAAGFNDALLKPVKPERLGFVLASMSAPAFQS
jgi:signal transduction histidine kinase